MADDTPGPGTGPDRDPGEDPAVDREHETGDEDESLIDEMRGSGVGLEDPNIVGDAEPGAVDEQVQKDQAPEV